jgi:hypothetical protein
MKQIGITTIIGDNYGSVLQNYALQTAIRQCGAEPHLISVRPRSYLLNYIEIILSRKQTGLNAQSFISYSQILEIT